MAAAVVAAGALALPLARGDVRLPGAAPTPVTGGDHAPLGTATTRGLTRGMRAALGAAGAAMRRDGVELALTSGYRSPAEQQLLYQQAIDRYGSPEAARHWVLPPAESEHVRGRAVDVRPPAAAAWLDEHGARFGLCRTMAWEWWHIEYRDAWRRAGSCPPPRRQQ